MNLTQPEIDWLHNRFTELEISSGTISSFGDVTTEYDILVHGAAMRIVSASVLNLSGKDVVDFVHRVSTNDVKSVNDNSKITTLFTNEKGRMIDRTVFIKMPDKSFLIGHASERLRLSRWIEKYIIMEDIKLLDESNNYRIFEFVGPQAESYLTMICGKCIDVLDDRNVIDISVETVSVKITRLKELNGTYKFWLMTKSENFEALIQTLLDQVSVFNFGLVGADAYNLYRILTGIPSVPKELNDNFNPHEGNVIEDVSFTKGCYIGQEVIARLDTYDKVQRELKNFIINGELDFNGEGFDILNEKDEEIGQVTSLARSVSDNKIIGLGYMRKKFKDHVSGKINMNNDMIDVLIKDINRK